MTEYVRQSLNHTITQMFKSDDGSIHALTLDPRDEQMLDDMVKESAKIGGSVSMPPDIMDKMLKQLSVKIEEMVSKGYSPLIITSPGIRMHFHSLIEAVLPGLIILSYGELTPTVKVESEGGISTHDD